MNESEMKKEFEDIKKLVMQGFEHMDEKIDAVDRNVGAIEKNLMGEIAHTQKLMREGFEALDSKIDSVQEQIEGIPSRMQGLENRMDREHEQGMDERYAFEQKVEKRLGLFEAKLKAA